MPSIEKTIPRIERVDDIPLLYGLVERMGVQEIIDNAITRHGNWQGISPGYVMAIWLVHILSEQNHKMEPVQLWVSRRLHTLEKVTGMPIRELDFADDRLASCLRALNEEQIWQEIEEKLGMNLLRVYDLPTDTMRLDATVGTVHHTAGDSELFAVGKAKNGLYETQFKLMMASLDPMGLGLAVDVEAGNCADDPLYIPCYERAKATLNRNGILVVGDSKMSAKGTRATIQENEDYYLMPLADKKDEPDLLQQVLNQWLEEGAESSPIFMPEDFPMDGGAPDPTVAIACAFERTRSLCAMVDGQERSWTERLVVVRSYSYMKSMIAGFQRRVDKAEAALIALTPPRQRGKTQCESEAELLSAIAKIEQKYAVKGLFEYDYEQEVEERTVRAYKERPARVERKVRYQLTVRRNQEAISAAEFAMGWRIYATNAPLERLSLTHVVLTYRGQIVQENVFRRLHGKFLSITPLYVQRDDHARGLIRLLTIGARLLALGDFLAREALAQQGAELDGIYSGNPKRSTPRPTTERMLQAFEGINLLIFPAEEQDRLSGQSSNGSTLLTDWLPVHDRILELLGLHHSLYSRFQSMTVG